MANQLHINRHCMESHHECSHALQCAEVWIEILNIEDVFKLSLAVFLVF